MIDGPAQFKLLEVAIDLFGQMGLDGVGTRRIAEGAGVQMSAITYYFRSKEGLYLACAEHIAAMMRVRIAPLMETGVDGRAMVDAKTRVEAIVSGMAVIMMQPEMAPIARFVVREQMNPTPAFSILYDGAMRQVAETVIALLHSISRGRLSDEDITTRCFALMGQVFAFRFARATLERVTNWSAVGPREIDLVRRTVVIHTRAIIADLDAGAFK
ncbi:MAG: CerR family C-terminal domain-containing protein [Pseudomonadota bacterium]